MTSRTFAALAAAFALALVGAGCGQDDEGGGGGGSGGAPENTAGFDGKTIKLGVLTPLTGPVAVIGEPLTAGNEVYFEAVNKKGGIGGKYKVELEQADTQYKPDRTVQQYNRVKSQVVAFTQVLGTAPTLAVLPQLKRDKALAAPASLDAFWVREENLLPIGGPYQVQAINSLDYYVKNGGEGKRICSLIQDDAYGEAGAASPLSRLSCGRTASVGAVPSTWVNATTWLFRRLYCWTVRSGLYCVSACSSSTLYLPAMPPFLLIDSK